ncbi:MAG: PQQ-binding-like beta-propeller repeat protein [Bacteroidota bacterium]|nr:PQQ-binding-like beta-propeller repeat protein [Bacteroidota bacterium]
MKNKLRLWFAVAVMVAGCKNGASDIIQTGKNFPVYGGNKGGNRYSPLDQINTGNVERLQVAWQYFANEDASAQRTRETQCQPIVVKGILYGTSAELKLFALDAATGQELWKFEPRGDKQKLNSNRGIVYWQHADDKRILYTAGAFLYAVNALTGKSITTFGNNGKVDLHEGLVTPGLGHEVNDLSVKATSPGVIYKNTFIIGSSVSESGDAAPGHIRAFDVVTGKLKWVFHTIPQPGEFGYETWPKDAYKKIGGTNNWGGMVVDDTRAAVYFGTGSPSADFYGGDREGNNLFSDCVVSLNAETGKMNWYFQTTHHDLWDRDEPCPPNLATITKNGKKIDVAVQATKDGLIYVLDRDKGTSLFPFEERPVPTTGLPGEHPYPTQRYPLKPLPFAHQVFTEDDITNISPESHAFVKKRFLETPQPNHKYIPPNTVGTIAFGYSGGAEWGGNAVDPNGILYQNSNDQPWDLVMADIELQNKEMSSLSRGNALYLQSCSGCHGADRKGSTIFPNLTNIDAKRTFEQINAIIKNGSGRMPSFANIKEDDRKAIASFLINKEPDAAKISDEHRENGVSKKEKKADFPYTPRYVTKIWKPFTDQDGYPAIKPPWGTLNAIDLNTGDYVWRIPLGEFPELTKKGIPITGTESYGGPCVTAGGLVFIAGTKDERIRAFDKKTGNQLWQYQLPAGGFATPVTYKANGKQYVAIAVGGGRGGKAGGWYMAFTLK